MDTEELLRLTVEREASDLYLIVPSPPVLRIDGKLVTVDSADPLTPQDTMQALASIATEKERQVLGSELELDFAYDLPEVSRFRCNASLQKGSISLVFRRVRSDIPSFEELGLPEVCKDLALQKRGVVLVTGPSGSGKSTTLAAMIDYINSQKSCHIVTVEDPIEYLFVNQKSIISQRELGVDTSSFATALKHVLRQAPDVIMVGEMRDAETAAAVLTATETGHMVLTTGHAPTAHQSIERVIDLFPPHEQPQAQQHLASMLAGVVCQILIPKLGAPGRVPAVEVMLTNPAVRNLIREGKIYHLPNVISTSSQAGMQPMDQDLFKLYREELISREDALALCHNREEFIRMLDGLRIVPSGTGVPLFDEL